MNDFKDVVNVAKNTGVGAIILTVFFVIVLFWNFVAGAIAVLLDLSEVWKSVLYFAPLALYLMYVMGGLYTSMNKN
jgi:hypothetical protein